MSKQRLKINLKSFLEDTKNLIKEVAYLKYYVGKGVPPQSNPPVPTIPHLFMRECHKGSVLPVLPPIGPCPHQNTDRVQGALR